MREKPYLSGAAGWPLMISVCASRCLIRGGGHGKQEERPVGEVPRVWGCGACVARPAWAEPGGARLRGGPASQLRRRGRARRDQPNPAHHLQARARARDAAVRAAGARRAVPWCAGGRWSRMPADLTLFEGDALSDAVCAAFCDAVRPHHPWGTDGLQIAASPAAEEARQALEDELERLGPPTDPQLDQAATLLPTSARRERRGSNPVLTPRIEIRL